MTRKPMLVLLSLALVVLVTSGLVIWDRTHRGSTPATAEQTLSVGSTRVVVERPTGTPPVTATPVPLRSLPPYAHAIGDSVHLQVGTPSGGGDYTVSFVLDPAALPAGVDPADGFVTLWSRPDAGAPWTWEGGRWDPVTSRLTVSTPHLSDWVAAVTDPAAAADAFDWGSDGYIEPGIYSVADTVGGKRATLDCPAEDVPRTYALSSTHATDIRVCLTQNPDTGTYHLEVANDAGIPFTVAVPASFHEVRPELWPRGLGATQDFIAEVFYNPARTGKVLLPVESKVVLEADREAVPRDLVLHADMAWGLWATDLGANFFEVAFAPEMRGAKGFTAVREVVERFKGKQWKEIADCLDKAGSKVPEVVDAARADRGRRLAAIAGEVLSECYSSAIRAVVAADKQGWFDAVNARLKSVLRSAGQPLDKVFDAKNLLDSIGKSSRLWTMGLLTVAGNAFSSEDFTAFDLKLRPVVAPRTAQDYLPAPPPGQVDLRVLTPVSPRIYGLPQWDRRGDPGGCSPNPLDLNDLAPYYDYPEADPALYGREEAPPPVGRYELYYEVETGHGEIRISRLASGRETHALNTLRAAPARCSGKWLPGGDTGLVEYTEVVDNQPTGPQTARTWAVVDHTLLPQGEREFHRFAIWGAWLLETRFVYAGDQGAGRRIFDQQNFRAAATLDDRVGSSFAGP